MQKMIMRIYPFPLRFPNTVSISFNAILTWWRTFLRQQKTVLIHLNAKVINISYFVFTLIQSHLLSRRKLNIMFSINRSWEPSISRSFKKTRHQIKFAEIPADDIRDFDIVVPLSIRDLKYLSENLALIPSNLIPIPSLNSINLCDDKYLFNQTLILKGFGEFIPVMGADLKYPYILKKRYDIAGENSYIVADPFEARKYKVLLTHPDYFTQEFIAGPHEYATHLLIKGGEIVRAINVKYCFYSAEPIKGKSKQIYQRICRCRYLDIFTSVLNSIGFEGLCCVNYKVCDDRPMILEINPRFGGSLCNYFFSFLKDVA